MFEKDSGHKGKTSVFGLYKTRSAIDNAVDQLKNNQFRNSDISVLMPDPQTSQNFAHEKGTKAPEGAATGATTGVVLGGALGWLVGAGALAIPGIGPFVAAGPILASIAGAGIGGTVGGVAGALVGLGIPEYEAKRYETAIKDGGMLLSVHADDGECADKAKRILETTGAEDISSSREKNAEPAKRSSTDTHPGLR